MVLERGIDHQDGLNMFGNSTSLVRLVKFECYLMSTYVLPF